LFFALFLVLGLSLFPLDSEKRFIYFFCLPCSPDSFHRWFLKYKKEEREREKERKKNKKRKKKHAPIAST